MAFVRQKGGYLYLVVSSRVSGKPRQKILAYFGRGPTRKKFEEKKAKVQAQFPGISVNWDRVARKLKEGKSLQGKTLWDTWDK